MHSGWHLLISLIIGTFFYLFTGSFEGSMACVMAGILIDIDHVIECLILHKKFDIGKIVDTTNFTLYKDRVVVSLHSFELILLVSLLGKSYITAGVALGMFSHMLSDFFYYRQLRQKSILSLFFLYRLSKRFSVDRLCN